MKKFLGLAGLAAMVAFSAGTAFAAPFNATNNPQTVANYPTGDHGIVGEPFLHQGADVVKKNGNSGNFQQWFNGTSAENGGIMEGDHSVWMHSSDGTCPNDNWVLVPNASANWGSYLQPGDYCVKTNDFNSSVQHTP